MFPGKLAAAVSAAKSCPVLQAPSGAGRPGRASRGPLWGPFRRGAPRGPPRGLGETQANVGDSKTPQEVVLPKDRCCLRKATTPQRLQLSQIFSRLWLPTARGRRSARTAKDAGGARSCWPTPATPSGLAAARPTPPPRARLPQPERPRLAGGAARREGRARRPQAGAPIGRGGGSSARGRREEGKPVAAAAAERAEAAGFVTVAPPRWLARGLRGLGPSGRAARGRSEWRPPGGGRAGGAGKEAAGGRDEGRGGGRGGAGRSRGRRPGPRNLGPA